MGAKRSVNFDWWGSIALGAALSALTLVLDQGQTWGWSSAPSVLCYIATVVFTILFIMIEQREPEPIVDLKFFKIGTFVNTLGTISSSLWG